MGTRLIIITSVIMPRLEPWPKLPENNNLLCAYVYTRNFTPQVEL